MTLFSNNKVKYYLVNDSYIGYVTRDARTSASFAVYPVLNRFTKITPISKHTWTKSISDTEKSTTLVLLDNNVLASSQFETIITQIVSLVFQKGAKRNKKQRQVDFNQVLMPDCSTVKTCSCCQGLPFILCASPLTISSLRERVHDHCTGGGVRHRALSNYLLYNYNDTPEYLSHRLKINIDLNTRLGLQIYSFPMKYIPLTGGQSKNRKYIHEPGWNWRFCGGYKEY